MRRYETTYILRPNLGEGKFTEIIERTNSIITDDGGSVINLDRWGMKRLAYEIKKEKQGYYVYFDFAADPSGVAEMERIFRLDDQVLRFLTIKLSDSIDGETITTEIERLNAAPVQEEESQEEEESSSEKSEQKSDSETKTTEEVKKETPAE